MLGKVPSLNVSVAAAVVLYEIVRQRRAGEVASNKK
jgi:tRNA G18 (ribose-2'-O)-methylase SpoU